MARKSRFLSLNPMPVIFSSLPRTSSGHKHKRSSTKVNTVAKKKKKINQGEHCCHLHGGNLCTEGQVLIKPMVDNFSCLSGCKCGRRLLLEIRMSVVMNFLIYLKCTCIATLHRIIRLTSVIGFSCYNHQPSSAKFSKVQQSLKKVL